MNKVELIGRLTRDPELRYTTSQKAVCEFTVAVNRPGRDAGADFIRVQTWERTAENCKAYLAKGSMVGVEGSIRVETYEKDGQKKQTTRVRADWVEFLTVATPDEKPESFQAIQEEIPF